MVEKLFFISNLILCRLLGYPIILAFHRIKKPDGSLLDQCIGATDPEFFEKVLNYLIYLRYRFVSLNELGGMIREQRTEKVAIVTFDDGYKDLYENAFPFLKEFNIPFTLFLITSTVDSERLLWLHKLYLSIDKLPYSTTVNMLNRYQENGKPVFNRIPGDIVKHKDRKVIENLLLELAKAAGLTQENEQLIAENLYLTKSELFEMKEHGLNIEIHAYEHFPLSNLDRNETEREIGKSIKFIKEELCVTPKFWCLPFGLRNKFVEDIARKIGLIGIVDGPSKLVRPFENIYNLPRIEVSNDILSFYIKLSKGYMKAFLDKSIIFRK